MCVCVHKHIRNPLSSSLNFITTKKKLMLRSQLRFYFFQDVYSATHPTRKLAFPPPSALCLCVSVFGHVQLFCDPTDYRPPGSSVHEISQARILEQVATSFSRGFSQPQGLSPCLLHCRQIFLPLSHQGSPQHSAPAYYLTH